MEFIAPIPFQEAIDKLGDQSIVGSTFSSGEWSDLPVELRENAFFSSRIESARFLQAAKDSLGEFLAGTEREALNAPGETKLATPSRAQFVDQMRSFLASEGVVRSTGGLTDIASEKRLGLIFSVKTRQAQDFGYWKQGMDPAVLNEFPAQRFIRVRDVREPRQTHELYQDQVYLKTDPIWWRVINADFGVPWGPWGWGCGHDVEDVDRDEAEKLHLLHPGQKLTPLPWSVNRNLQASIKTMDPDLVAKLKKEFGDRVVIEGDVIRWATALRPTLASPVTTTSAPAAVPAVVRTNPVSDAIVLKVYGNLAGQTKAALAAIDEVHDDGSLSELPLVETRKPYYGFLKPVLSATGMKAESLAVRASGPWPAFTAVHEIGHLLDLEAIGTKGTFATLTAQAGMDKVLAAAERTAAIQGLRSSLAATRNFEHARYISYLLKPEEIWARAYAQFVASKAGSQVLATQLQLATASEKNRQWEPADFTPVASAIETMFKGLGWL